MYITSPSTGWPYRLDEGAARGRGGEAHDVTNTSPPSSALRPPGTLGSAAPLTNLYLPAIQSDIVRTVTRHKMLLCKV